MKKEEIIGKLVFLNKDDIIEAFQCKDSKTDEDIKSAKARYCIIINTNLQDKFLVLPITTKNLKTLYEKQKSVYQNLCSSINKEEKQMVLDLIKLINLEYSYNKVFKDGVIQINKINSSIKERKKVILILKNQKKLYDLPKEFIEKNKLNENSMLNFDILFINKNILNKIAYTSSSIPDIFIKEALSNMNKKEKIYYEKLLKEFK